MLHSGTVCNLYIHASALRKKIVIKGLIHTGSDLENLNQRTSGSGSSVKMLLLWHEAEGRQRDRGWLDE